MSAVARWLDSDVAYSFRRSPVALVAALVLLVILSGAVLAPWIAPHNPRDLASLNLMDSRIPPVWGAEGQWSFPLGTDDQGRDILSGIYTACGSAWSSAWARCCSRSWPASRSGCSRAMPAACWTRC